jgi:hypothetical protein
VFGNWLASSRMNEWRTILSIETLAPVALRRHFSMALPFRTIYVLSSIYTIFLQTAKLNLSFKNFPNLLNFIKLNRQAVRICKESESFSGRWVNADRLHFDVLVL